MTHRIVHICHNTRFYKSFVEPMVLALRSSGYAATSWTIDPDKVLGEEVTRRDVYTDINLNPIIFVQRILKLTWLMVQYKPDIIHTHTTRGSLIPLICGFLVRIPIRIYHNHGFPYLGYKGPLRFFLKLLDKINIALATSVITVSDSNKKAVLTDGIDANKEIHVLHKGSAFGVPENIFQKSQPLNQQIKSQIRFGFVGRPVARKGFADLLLAWNQSNLSQQGHTLIIAGCSKSDGEAIIGHNSNGIEFLGWVENMVEFYKNIDVLLLPSYHEGFGQCILEAAAFGVPTIGSNIPGISCAIIHNKTGLLHKAGDREEIIGLMKYIVKNPSELVRLGQNAYIRTKQDFTRHLLTQSLLEYYQKIAS